MAKMELERLDSLDRIFSILRAGAGHDFSLYKSNTICRRISRRMSTLGFSLQEDYADYLSACHEEVGILLKELLIGVTAFFRDSSAYEALKSIICYQMMNKEEDDVYRVWIPACSTGEEAYSTAILLQECLDKINRNLQIQIFASDIDERAIAFARSGVYKAEVMRQTPQARLNRFFTRAEGDSYRILQEIREQIVFAVQSVIKDPPFTRIDLLSCRNLLIYLGPQLQKKILPLFHYSLNVNGLLFLGASESVGAFSDHYECLDKKHKIYKRKELEFVSRSKLKFPITRVQPKVRKITQDKSKRQVIKTDLHYSLEQMLLEHCLPPCVIVNKNGEILYIHGSIGHLFEPNAGLPSLNIIDMARSGLGTKLSYGIREVNPNNPELSYRNVTISEPYHCRFNLTIKWIESDQSLDGLVLMAFEEVSLESPAPELEGIEQLQDDPRIIELERELKFTKESLQSTIEELKSTNEELQSTNEELQSTNEELETSKEELVTVNSELESRIDELTVINDDIKNLLDSTNIATIFLDKQFLIKRYTPKAVDIVRFIKTDIGRPIFDIVHNLECDDFFDLLKEVACKGCSLEQEIRSQKDLTYFMRITPYFTAQGAQEGLVLTFEDISELKLHREHLEQVVDKRTSEIELANKKLVKEASFRLEAERELREYQKKHARINCFNTAGEIATGIAHEINQPLANITNYIAGMLERLENNSLKNDELKTVLEKLSSEANRTSAIVDNMRKLIQRRPNNTEKLDLNMVVHDVVAHFKVKLSKDKIKVQLFLMENIPTLFMDSRQMEQVLINLIGNAIEGLRFLPSNRRKIRVRTEYDAHSVRISVEDDGDEIGLDVVKKMFDLFFTTKSDGLGMGLAITRTIVESYGGYITYVSDNDRHNIFKVTLPLDAEPDD